MKEYKPLFKENKKEDDAFDGMLELYETMTGTQEDYKGYGKVIAELFVEIFKGATYGDYPIEDAQNNLNEAMKGFNSIKKKI